MHPGLKPLCPASGGRPGSFDPRRGRGGGCAGGRDCTDGAAARSKGLIGTLPLICWRSKRLWVSARWMHLQTEHSLRNCTLEIYSWHLLSYVSTGD